MDTIRSILFESPLYVYVALGLCELVLAGMYLRRRSRSWALALVAPPLLGAALWGLAALVETDREVLSRAADEIAADVAGGRDAALRLYLDEGFVGQYRGQSLNKAQCLALCGQEVRRNSIVDIKLARGEIIVDGKRATMSMPASFRVEVPGAVAFNTTATFSLEWIKRPGGWRILRAAEPRTPLAGPAPT